MNRKGIIRFLSIFGVFFICSLFISNSISAEFVSIKPNLNGEMYFNLNDVFEFYSFFLCFINNLSYFEIDYYYNITGTYVKYNCISGILLEWDIINGFSVTKLSGKEVFFLIYLSSENINCNFIGYIGNNFICGVQVLKLGMD
jgi:hypothetical protein